jgi:hypothetical protein
LRRTTRPPPTTQNIDKESTHNPSKRRYLFTEDQRRVLKQTFENEQYPNQAKLEQLVDELSLPINKISNWFHNARMRAKTNIQSSDTHKVSTSPINNDENESEDDNDDDDTLPTIVPLNSSWFNETADSDSSTSAISLSTNTVSLIDEQKPSSSSLSTLNSSSKKRKSVPQKIITTKKLHIDESVTENDDNEKPTND